MSQQHTYAEIAADWALWSKFVDGDATMTREEFDAMSIDAKVALQIEAFGAERARVMVAGHAVDYDAAVNLMDDEIREEMHTRMAPCTDQEFIDAYVAAHAEKFSGEQFEVD